MRENEEMDDDDATTALSLSLPSKLISFKRFLLPSMSNVELMTLTPFAAECETHSPRSRRRPDPNATRRDEDDGGGSRRRQGEGRRSDCRLAARLPQLESLGLPCFASLLPRENIRTCPAAAARSHTLPCHRTPTQKWEKMRDGGECTHLFQSFRIDRRGRVFPIHIFGWAALY